MSSVMINMSVKWLPSRWSTVSDMSTARLLPDRHRRKMKLLRQYNTDERALSSAPAISVAKSDNCRTRLALTSVSEGLAARTSVFDTKKNPFKWGDLIKIIKRNRKVKLKTY